MNTIILWSLVIGIIIIIAGIVLKALLNFDVKNWTKDIEDEDLHK